MSNRYILDPSGNIIKVNSDSSNVDKNVSPKESLYYTESDFVGNETYLGSFIKDGALSSYGSIGAVELTFINDTTNNNNIIKSLTDENPSFGFIGQNGEETSVETKQFRQYNNANVLSNKDGKPLPFVNEFEFYSGFTDPFGEDNNPGLESLNLLVNYFTSVVVEAAIIESLIVLYKLAQDSSTIQGNRLDTNKKFLVMGEYILDEVDVFSRYFFDVINYPIEEKSVSGTYFLKRLACYFIGLNEWLSHDRVFSWERFLNVDNVPIIGSLNADLKTILEKTVDITLSNFSNASSLKRILLLVKKFNTQKYWVNEQLYRFKSKNYSDEITNIYNYYYFKFFVERVNVGIKIYNRIYAEDSIKKIVKKEHKTNRISQDFNDKNKYFISKIDFNNDKELSNIKNSIRDLALSNKSGQELADEVNKIKDNLNSAKNKNAKYDFNQVFKGLSIKSIPSALMFNKTKVPITANNINVIHKHFAATNENYLPIELVNKIEKNLEAEYMPFYFHDLRTNELLSFHAFIENISDSYSPEYAATSGFGRIDDVRTYIKTTRSISLSFTVAAMNKSDHATMWYYLNKLVSMVYPQWSRGEELSLNELKLEQPFSQVPTNSPLIRMRLGDLIKNNYSRFNLSKIFGLKDYKNVVTKTLSDTKRVIDISQMGLTDNDDLRGKDGLKISLTNYAPFANKNDDVFNIIGTNTNKKYTSSLKKFELSKDYDSYYVIFTDEESNNYVPIPLEKSSLYKTYMHKLNSNEEFSKDLYNTLYNKYNEEFNENEIKEIEFIDDFEIESIKIYNDSNFNLAAKNKMYFTSNDIQYKNITTESEETVIIKTHDIMKPFNDDGTINNPITQAYESRMSKGLAGHITSLDFNYSDFTWEIEDGSKAPMMVKVSLNFAPIHDIPPGLDEKGMMRAANYNIGNLNKHLFS